MRSYGHDYMRNHGHEDTLIAAPRSSNGASMRSFTHLRPALALGHQTIDVRPLSAAKSFVAETVVPPVVTPVHDGRILSVSANPSARCTPQRQRGWLTSFRWRASRPPSSARAGTFL
jgi:hypothetical protein